MEDQLLIKDIIETIDEIKQIIMEEKQIMNSIIKTTNEVKKKCRAMLDGTAKTDLQALNPMSNPDIAINKKETCPKPPPKVVKNEKQITSAINPTVKPPRAINKEELSPTVPPKTDRDEKQITKKGKYAGRGLLRVNTGDTEHVYWDTASELIKRLQLVMASHQTGEVIYTSILLF